MHWFNQGCTVKTDSDIRGTGRKISTEEGTERLQRNISWYDNTPLKLGSS